MALGQWALQLTATALICAIVLSLAGRGYSEKLLRLVCGVILALGALSPLKQLELPEMSSWQADFTGQGAAAAEAGAEMARHQRSAGIKETLEAYIMREGARLGATVTAEVALDPEGMPRETKVQGAVSAAQRQQLEQMLEGQLGICREDIQWTGINGGLS